MKKGALVFEAILIVIGVALTLFSILSPVQQNGMPENQPATQDEMQAPPQDAANQPGDPNQPGAANQPGDFNQPGAPAQPQSDAPNQEGMGMPQDGQPAAWGGIVSPIVSLIIYLFIIYYAFAGYKVPHGNILRYLTFAFAFLLVYKSTMSGQNSVNYAMGVCAVIAAYISGRLNKIQTNKILMLIATILIVYYVVSVAMTTNLSFGMQEISRLLEPVGVLVQWLVIMNTYIERYKEHTEAGLEDKGVN